MARGNQISNAVGTGLKAHSGGPEAHHYSAEFGGGETMKVVHAAQQPDTWS